MHCCRLLENLWANHDKKIILITLSIFVTCSLGIRADIFNDLSSLEKDKYVHFSAGVVISHTSYPIFKKYLKNKKGAWIYSFSFAVFASTLKELCDIKDTGFNSGDRLAGALGGLTVITVKF